MVKITKNHSNVVFTITVEKTESKKNLQIKNKCFGVLKFDL